MDPEGARNCTPFSSGSQAIAWPLDLACDPGIPGRTAGVHPRPAVGWNPDDRLPSVQRARLWAARDPLWPLL